MPPVGTPVYATRSHTTLADSRPRCSEQRGPAHFFDLVGRPDTMEPMSQSETCNLHAQSAEALFSPRLSGGEPDVKFSGRRGLLSGLIVACERRPAVKSQPVSSPDRSITQAP